jgi:hypothetical protein
MRFAVDGLGCLGVGRLKEAVDLTLLLLEPILEGLSSVLVLDLEALLVVLGHRFGR